MTDVSAAMSIKRFLDKLGKPKDQDRTTAKVIAEAYGISEDSPEFQFLIHTQNDNFYRLRTQLNLTDMRKDARRNYKGQVDALSHVVRFSFLNSRYHAIHAEYITTNIVALTYLDEALRLVAQLDDHAKTDIENLIHQLQSALEDSQDVDLPLRIKSTLQVQISRLIFLLKHYETAGVDQLWEQACATVVTLQNEAPNIRTNKEKGLFVRIANLVERPRRNPNHHQFRHGSSYRDRDEDTERNRTY
jgi:hypothetical protein